IAFNRITADGYFSGRDGSLSWVVPDETLDNEVGVGIDRSIFAEGKPGTLLFGRRTYDMFESFWPRALDDPSQGDPHSAVIPPSAAMRAMAVWINEATKIVFSRTRTGVAWRNSRLVHEFDAAQVQALKQEVGPDILIFGSGSIVSQLTDHGLIDEYRFVVGPVVLGEGRTLVTGVRQAMRLELL